ncbi:hypothetical protein ACJJTC_006560 [Scirpophaga incertulas]
MPLRRTPPPAATATPPQGRTPSSASTIQNNPMHDLSALDRGNVTERRKNKSSSNLESFMEEMRELIVKSTEQTNIKFSSLQSTINEILTQNKELKQLESKVETLEQVILSSKLELKNIPIESTASKENLCEIVIKAANVLEVPLHQHEIKDIFRIKNKSGFGTITVDLGSALKKEKFIKNARRFNIRNSTNKLNSSHLSLAGPQIPIFVSDHLSQRARRLNCLARTFAQEHGFRFCWTSNGRTYLRKSEGERHIRVDSESDLSTLKKEM